MNSRYFETFNFEDAILLLDKKNAPYYVLRRPEGKGVKAFVQWQINQRHHKLVEFLLSLLNYLNDKNSEKRIIVIQ